MKKREYPKTVFRKKLIKGIFWTGFALVLFLSVVAIVRVENAGKGAAAEEPEQKQGKLEDEMNLAAGEGGKTFAQNFASDYFNWGTSDEAKKKRVDRLARYLATGLDQQAGLDFEGIEWNSKLTTSQVWQIEETGDNSALVTLRIMHELNKVTPPDPKALEKAKKAKKALPKPKEEKAGPYEKYFAVPVKTDGQSFVVHKTPYFVAAPKKPEIEADVNIDEEGKIHDSELQEKIMSFLSPFFKVYTTGTEEELSYYVKGQGIESMKGIMTFKEVKSVIVKNGKKNSDYEVYTTVIFEENRSKAKVAYPYQMILTKEEDRWFVKKIKNQ